MRRTAQAIGRLPAHADRLCGMADKAGIGQSLNKPPLLFLGPAIGPRTATDGNPAIVGWVVGFRFGERERVGVGI